MSTTTRPPLPSTVGELIDLLDKIYPHRCVGRGESIEDAHRRAGQREVVEYLLQLRSTRSASEIERHVRF